MKLKIKKATQPKRLVVRRPSVEPIPVQSEEEVIKGLMHAQVLRRKHYTEQIRIFGGMEDLQYRLFSRRLEQLIAIENAGMRPCVCPKCAGKCIGKLFGSSPYQICHDCGIGKHKGVPSITEPEPTVKKVLRVKKRKRI